MKRLHRLLAVLSILNLVPLCLASTARAYAVAPVDDPFSSLRLARIAAWQQTQVDAGGIPGAVAAIARNGKVAYLRAVGFRDRAKTIPLQTDAIFWIASMTKPITSVAAMMLVEDGKLNLAAPVHQYLPELKDVMVGVDTKDPVTGKTGLALEPQKRPMTVEDLLRHTAGLVYGQFGDRLVHQAYREANVRDRGQSLAEMVKKLATLPLAHHPGEVWEYSMGTDVLGRVIEVVSGMELDRFISERITKPLGMAATDFYVHQPDLARLAEAQASAEGKRPDLPDVTQKPRLLSGGGGMVSSAADYLRFSLMLQNGGEYAGVRLLSPHTVRLMTSDALPPNIGYTERGVRTNQDVAPMPQMGQGFGLGFAVRTAAGRNPLPGSIGTYYWTGAWGTTFFVDPQEKLVAIQLIQTPANAGGPYRRLFRQLTYSALTGTETER